jgi:3-methyladenine DNA glycosylase AlkD
MTQATTPDPEQAAAATLAWLRQHADERRAASYQRFFKEPVAFFGVANGLVQRHKQELLQRVRGSWSIREAVRFGKAMVADPHMESRGIGFQIVAQFVPEASAGLLAQVKTWLQRCCDNWGLVDNLAPSVLAPLIERHPEIIPEVRCWTGSSNLWLRRGAAVAFVPLAKRGLFLDEAYAVATALLADGEELMHKAVGWLLREAGKTDMRRLERYLLAHGPRIPRTTVRYAIERFAENERQRLLAATKVAKRP